MGKTIPLIFPLRFKANCLYLKQSLLKKFLILLKESSEIMEVWFTIYN